jgi:hypothetical protein
MVSPGMSAMRLSDTVGRWLPLAPAPITGAPSGSSRKKSDPPSKKVSKELRTNIR